MSRHTPSRPVPPGSVSLDGSSSSSTESPIPTLRVMRLQSPALHHPPADISNSFFGLHNALCLPDSLQVLVGENFTAYLGVLNVSRSITIRRLSVQAHLQTPSERWQLPSPLQSATGVDIPTGSLVDAIVSHTIEEPGQHILRVEVSFASMTGPETKTFRKFYRFQVVNPLNIKTTAVRLGDDTCVCQFSVEYSKEAADGTPVVIAAADFLPTPGLQAERMGRTTPLISPATENDTTLDEHTLQQQQTQIASTATQLLDTSGILGPGSIQLYLFKVSTVAAAAFSDGGGTPGGGSSSKGLAAGDKLGTAVFTWRKSMGETGRIQSLPVLCPAVLPQLSSSGTSHNGGFVVHRSGLSVDVASLADNRTNPRAQKLPLSVTVEPLNPPNRMILFQPAEVDLYIVNHDEEPMTLQLQFRLACMTEMAVCGPSFVSLGQVEGRGGSTVCTIRLIPLATGLLTVQGCWVVDLASDHEMAQPPLFHVFCVEDGSTDTFGDCKRKD